MKQANKHKKKPTCACNITISVDSTAQLEISNVPRKSIYKTIKNRTNYILQPKKKKNITNIVHVACCTWQKACVA